MTEEIRDDNLQPPRRVFVPIPSIPKPLRTNCLNRAPQRRYGSAPCPKLNEPKHREVIKDTKLNHDPQWVAAISRQHSRFAPFNPLYNQWNDSASALKVHYRQWVESLEKEQNDFMSMAVCSEVFLKQVMATTSSLDTPNPLRTAMCCQLLDLITSKFGSYQPVLAVLRNEILASIYDGFRPADEGESPDYISFPLFAERWKQVESQFRLFQIEIKQVAYTMQRQGNVLQHAVSTWQRMLIERVFTAWKNYTKRSRNKISIYVMTQAQIREIKLIKKYWYSWRSWIEIHKLKEVTNRLREELIEVNSKMEKATERELSLQQRVDELENERKKDIQTIENNQFQLTKLRVEVEELRKTLEQEQLRSKGWQHLCTDLFDEWVGDTFQRPPAIEMLFTPMTPPEPEAVQQEISLSESIQFKKGKGSGRIATPKDPTKLQSNLDYMTQACKGYSLGALPPMERLLILFINKILMQSDPYGDLVKDVGLDLKDGSKYFILAKALLGPPPGGKQPRSMNIMTRMQWVVNAFSSWLGYHPVDPLKLVEGEINSHSLLLGCILERYATTGPRTRSSTGFVQQAELPAVWSQFHYQVQCRGEWKQIAQKSRRFTLLLGTGTPLNVEGPRAQKEFEIFTAFHPFRISDLLQDTPQSFQMSMNEILASIKSVLEQHFGQLRKIYNYYALLETSDEGATLMSRFEYWRFCRDCELVSKPGLTKALLNEIFITANMNSIAIKQQHQETIEVDTRPNPDTELTPIEWIECLIRMSVAACPETLSIHQQLEEFLTTQIFPYACEREVDDLRKTIYQKDVQSVLQTHHQQLLRFFRSYCRNTVDALTFEEFETMMHDARLLDTTFSAQACVDICKAVQDIELTGVEKSLVYQEFLDSLVVVCIFKNPTPYIPLHDRLQSFLTNLLLPRLINHPKVRSKGKSAPLSKKTNSSRNFRHSSLNSYSDTEPSSPKSRYS